jgi:hypothetical protein
VVIACLSPGVFNHFLEAIVSVTETGVFNAVGSILAEEAILTGA